MTRKLTAGSWTGSLPAFFLFPPFALRLMAVRCPLLRGWIRGVKDVRVEEFLPIRIGVHAAPFFSGLAALHPLHAPLS